MEKSEAQPPEVRSSSQDAEDVKRTLAELREANERLLVAGVRMQELAEEAEEARARLMQQLVKAHEHEQRRIAHELHDQIGQQITALRLKIRALRDKDELHPHLAHEVERLEQIAKQLDEDVDFLVWQLRPTALDDLGLVEAISDYVSDWSRHCGVSAKLHLTGIEGTRLSGEVETVLYRVMQEALNNVAKHAGAKNVELELRHGPVETVLNIADDGAGFDLKRQHRDGRKHFGLDGMRERAALVRGTVRVEGRPGDGTAVTVRIPVSGAG